jgi:minor pilin subunit PapF
MKGVPGSVKLLLVLMGSGFFFGMQPAGAVDVTIKITGEIYIPPCVINNDTGIKVSFGEMSLYEVDGEKNAKTTSVNVTCDYYQGTPYIFVGGAQLSGAGDNVLKTTGANPSTLGIALYQGGNVDTSHPLKIGQGEQGRYGYKITRGLAGQNTASGTFMFTAVPYKHGELKAGTFSAIATMSISYL